MRLSNLEGCNYRGPKLLRIGFPKRHRVDADALAFPEADTGAARFQQFALSFPGYSPTVIPYLNGELVIALNEGLIWSRSASGMPMNIGQAFLTMRKYGDLDLSGKRPKSDGMSRVNFYFAALGENHPTYQRRAEVSPARRRSGGWSRWRWYEFRGKPLPLTCISETALCPAESSLSDCDRTTAIFIANRSEQLTHAVVQFPSDAPSFVNPASVENGTQGPLAPCERLVGD